MTTFDFKDPYIKRIVNHFTSTLNYLTSDPSRLSQEEAEFEVAKSLDDEISSDDHIAFIESIQKLSETLISCTVGVFETRQEGGNKIAVVSLVKMLSQLFLVGHQACEDRLKFKWTSDGTKEIEDKIELYKDLSESILNQQQTTFEEFPPQQEYDQQNQKEEIIRVKEIKNEPDIIEISDDEEDSRQLAIPSKRPRIETSTNFSSANNSCQNNLNSVTEGCQNEFFDETNFTPILSKLLNIPPEMRTVPQVCLTYTEGVTVGYSDAGKKPILIVTDPKMKDNVFTYRSMIRGSYRCTSCGLLNVHRYAKLYQGILYANIHECKGKPRKAVEQEQRLRAIRFNYKPLPSLLELSAQEDPRPYPPYPKKRPITRPQNPNQWEDLIEYQNFSTCSTNRPGIGGYVAYDDFDPTICYEYSPSSRGSYRCNLCVKFRKHTIAKIDESRNILQSAAHVCNGMPLEEFESNQIQRRQWNPSTNYIEIDDFEL
jgi:uncharacterized protein YqgV (UPF0045/DUF77 family)